MQRKKIISILTAIALIAMASGLSFWLLRERKTISEALNSIPIDAAIVVKVDPFGQLHKQLYAENDFWAAMRGFKLVADANSFITLADSLRKSSSIFQQLVFDNQVLMSAHVVGNGRAELFFAANISERVKPSDIWTLISEAVGLGSVVTEKEYNGVQVFTFSSGIKDSDWSLSVAIYRGVVMASKSFLLVESAIGQMGNNVSLLNDTSFGEILKTSGTRVVANVFINHTKLPPFLAPQIHPARRKGFQNLSRVGHWSELDLTIRNDFFFLNGFGQSSDTLNTFYRVLAKQKPIAMTIPDVLPAQTVAMVFFGISDINTYLSSYQKYLDGYGLLYAYNHAMERNAREVGTDFSVLYKTIFGKELALAFIPFEGLSISDCWFVVSNTKGQSLARQELLNVIETYAKRSGQRVASFHKVFNVDREKSVNIYQFPISGMHKALFGNLFIDVNDQYFTFIDSYVIFGSSVESLSRFILANIHNKQLSNEPNFKRFSEGLSQESNFTAYINPGKAETLYGQMLDPASAARFLSRIEVAQKIQGIGIQLTGGKSMIFNNVYSCYTPQSIDAPQTVWETKLDTTFAMKPQLVINHNTQNREIFVQDIKNNIYLINDVGRVLWKRPLQETILGEVHQIDVFRNGKLQYLFNTKNYLYLVDRNGNNVDGFPVTLRSSATNPVAVFDYEGNRDYRFFLAGEDRKIYVYNRNANIVTGWDFDRTEKIVTKPLQHFRVGGRDYIIFADENRPYILDRRGNERVKPSRYFSQAQHGTFVLDESSPGATPRFVTSDSMGIVRFVNLNGKVDELILKKISPFHTFDFQDVNGDGFRDFIFLDGDQIMVYSNNGKELFTRKLSQNLLPSIIYFHFGLRDRKLGITCLETSQIYLINGDGSLYRGFPLKGITPFSIGQFANTRTTFNLIVGSPSGFLLNYAVQ